MSLRTVSLDERLHQYVIDHSVHEHPVLAERNDQVFRLPRLEQPAAGFEQRRVLPWSGTGIRRR